MCVWMRMTCSEVHFIGDAYFPTQHKGKLVLGGYIPRKCLHACIQQLVHGACICTLCTYFIFAACSPACLNGGTCRGSSFPYCDCPFWCTCRLPLLEHRYSMNTHAPDLVHKLHTTLESHYNEHAYNDFLLLRRIFELPISSVCVCNR